MSSARNQTDYFIKMRMAYIAEQLRVVGFINSVHLERKFGISNPQAIQDLQRFGEENPKAMWYNASNRRFEPMETNPDG